MGCSSGRDTANARRYPAHSPLLHSPHQKWFDGCFETEAFQVAFALLGGGAHKETCPLCSVRNSYVRSEDATVTRATTDT